MQNHNGTFHSGGWLTSHDATNRSKIGKLLLVLPISLYGALLLIAGSLGNFGLAYVLLGDRRRLKLTTRILFCLLALTDTMVLWTAVLRYWIRITFGWDFRVAYPWLCPLHVFLVYVMANLAVTVFCILCVDRCMVIYHNLEGYRNHFERQTRNTMSSVEEITLADGATTSPPVVATTKRSKVMLQLLRLLRCTQLRRLSYTLCCLIQHRPKHRVMNSDNCRFSNPSNDESANNDCAFYKSPERENLAYTLQKLSTISAPDFNSSRLPRYCYLSPPRLIVSPPSLSEESRSNISPVSTDSRPYNCCSTITSAYTHHSGRWLSIGLLMGLILVLTKHSVAYAYVGVDRVKGCSSKHIGEWRDYLDFATQAILAYCIIIPADIIVYRAISRHKKVLASLKIFNPTTTCHGRCNTRGLCQSPTIWTWNRPMRTRTIHVSSFRSGHVTKGGRGQSCVFPPQSPVNLLTGHPSKYRRRGVLGSVLCNGCAPNLPCSHSTKSIVAAATHMSNGHLFIFKTLITLGLLQFFINLPGYLYAQVILPSLGDWWYRTLEGQLIYDSLFLVSFTNSGASFFILLFTVRGFRQRAYGLMRRSFLGRLLIRFRAESITGVGDNSKRDPNGVFYRTTVSRAGQRVDSPTGQMIRVVSPTSSLVMS